jgi:hypothetical protein
MSGEIVLAIHMARHTRFGWVMIHIKIFQLFKVRGDNTRRAAYQWAPCGRCDRSPMVMNDLYYFKLPRYMLRLTTLKF